MGQDRQERGKPRGPLRRLLPVAVLLGLLVAFFAAGLDEFVTFETLKAHRTELQDFVTAHLVAAVLLYLVVYVVVTAASLPVATLLTLVGGFLFGWFGGAALTVLGATSGATIVFLVARSAFGDPLRRRAGPYLMRMEAGFRRNAWSYLLFLRLMPVFPFVIVNIAPAFLGVATRIFVATTLLGIVPGTMVYSVVGAGLGEVLDSGQEFSVGAVATPEILLGLAGLALLSLAPALLRRYRGRTGAA